MGDLELWRVVVFLKLEVIRQPSESRTKDENKLNSYNNCPPHSWAWPIRCANSKCISCIGSFQPYKVVYSSNFKGGNKFREITFLRSLSLQLLNRRLEPELVSWLSIIEEALRNGWCSHCSDVGLFPCHLFASAYCRCMDVSLLRAQSARNPHSVLCLHSVVRKKNFWNGNFGK